MSNASSSGKTQIHVGRVDDLPIGSMCEVPLDAPFDVPVNAIVANVHGTFYATSSRCTHYGMPLSKGVLTDDGKLYCPFPWCMFPRNHW